MKRKVLAIFLSIAIIVTLLIPSTLVKAEPNEVQEQEEVTDETTQNDEKQIIEEQGTESQVVGEQEDQQPNEAQVTEEAINPNSYDPILYNVILYTLQKVPEQSITIKELESIKKIDIEELQKKHSDLENITIGSFSLLQYVTSLEELNLGNTGWNTLKALNLGDDSWDGIEALSKLPRLNKLKINGCTFNAFQPETTISKDLLSKLKIVKDTTENAQAGDKILEIQLDDFTITKNNKTFTIPNINEMKLIDQSEEIDKANVLSSEIISSYKCSIDNYEVTFSSDTFEESQFPVEIKLSSNRIKAIIRINILVDESLLTPGNQEDNEDVTKPDEGNKDETKNTAPVITASDKTIIVGEVFEPLAGVTAKDAEDGDITAKIKVVENMVDINSIGKYSVTFEVIDSAGLKSSKSINVKVDKAAVEVNKAPKISASNKVIKSESKFNPYSEVTASDYEDGDITDKVKVIYNNLNTNVTGLYRIIYEVTDSGGYKVTKTIYVNVIPKSNTRPIIYVDNIIVPLGSRYNPYAMVSAYDNEDGNITGRISVLYNHVNVYKEGAYKVGYKVTDSMGMSASCVVKVTVKNYYGKEDINKNQDPVIYANDISVALNTKFDPLEWVAATDKEDGDITNRVMVIINDVNTSVEGNYHVTYEVVDSSGNKVNKAMMVYVKKEDVVKEQNVEAVINAADLTIEKGVYFDPLDGVTALDEEDGNLTHKITIEENEVNVSKLGTYKVIYKVTDSMGKTASKSIVVTVESNHSIINYELFAKVGGVLIIILLIGSLSVMIITKKKQ
ncbi:immunoglobulin-like domain-containing protein [Clostridium sp. D53t1_180928_C8]|uniref:immunoglobulin-like domain-containing protein n=1 Tax=Clostridium sp. D53t1_180928_C8 TaxID=2787101 RepID=UPI0018AA9B2D|nr:immunoglobulin-like domain-containing protein [Clostridium sp. D53t1_180928_C8]